MFKIFLYNLWLKNYTHAKIVVIRYAENNPDLATLVYSHFELYYSSEGGISRQANVQLGYLQKIQRNLNKLEYNNFYTYTKNC